MVSVTQVRKATDRALSPLLNRISGAKQGLRNQRNLLSQFNQETQGLVFPQRNINLQFQIKNQRRNIELAGGFERGVQQTRFIRNKRNIESQRINKLLNERQSKISKLESQIPKIRENVSRQIFKKASRREQSIAEFNKKQQQKFINENAIGSAVGGGVLVSSDLFPNQFNESKIVTFKPDRGITNLNNIGTIETIPANKLNGITKKVSIPKNNFQIETFGSFLNKKQGQILKSNAGKLTGEQLQVLSNIKGSGVKVNPISPIGGGTSFIITPTKEQTKIAKENAIKEFKKLPSKKRFSLVGSDLLVTGGQTALDIAGFGIDLGIGSTVRTFKKGEKMNKSPGEILINKIPGIIEFRKIKTSPKAKFIATTTSLLIPSSQLLKSFKTSKALGLSKTEFFGDTAFSLTSLKTAKKQFKASDTILSKTTDLGISGSDVSFQIIKGKGRNIPDLKVEGFQVSSPKGSQSAIVTKKPLFEIKGGMLRGGTETTITFNQGKPSTKFNSDVSSIIGKNEIILDNPQKFDITSLDFLKVKEIKIPEKNKVNAEIFGTDLFSTRTTGISGEKSLRKNNFKLGKLSIDTELSFGASGKTDNIFTKFKKQSFGNNKNKVNSNILKSNGFILKPDEISRIERFRFKLIDDSKTFNTKTKSPNKKQNFPSLSEQSQIQTTKISQPSKNIITNPSKFSTVKQKIISPKLEGKIKNNLGLKTELKTKILSSQLQNNNFKNLIGQSTKNDKKQRQIVKTKVSTKPKISTIITQTPRQSSITRFGLRFNNNFLFSSDSYKPSPPVKSGRGVSRGRGISKGGIIPPPLIPSVKRSKRKKQRGKSPRTLLIPSFTGSFRFSQGGITGNLSPRLNRLGFLPGVRSVSKQNKRLKSSGII